jgi:ubiquinone biosynthesis monooxygenase Coq7
MHANLKLHETLGDRIIKVNHAGEHGAVNIYRGQLLLARFTAAGQVDALRGFLAHERRHRQIFENELLRRQQARCKAFVLCGAGGYVLGMFTGLLGRRAIAATTYAIENVVLKHLQAQLAALAGRDDHAVEAISGILAEEAAHRDHYAELSPGDRFWRAFLLPLVAACTESVIWLGMRLRGPARPIFFPGQRYKIVSTSARENAPGSIGPGI